MVANRKIKRLRAEFSGRVQGVGFRYSVCRVAEHLKVNGFVRNLPNGEVELLAEGMEQDLLELLNGIRQSGVGCYIMNEQLQWSTARQEFSSFGIQY